MYLKKLGWGTLLFYRTNLTILIILFTFVDNKAESKNAKYNIMLNNEQIVYDVLKAKGYTNQAAAAVMGVVGGESAFKTLKEASYRNTPNSRIRAIFSSRLGNESDSEINKLKASDELFFNAVYGGIYGNSPTEGYKYVGRGFNGITFKSNYQNAAKLTGIDFVNKPELLEQPRNAAEALAAYFINMKDISNFDEAFKTAYRMNAGPGNSWQFYQNSTNPVHVQGIPLKRKKAEYYLSQFGSYKTALFFFVVNSNNGDMVFSSKIEDHKKITNLENFINSLKK